MLRTVDLQDPANGLFKTLVHERVTKTKRPCGYPESQKLYVWTSEKTSSQEKVTSLYKTIRIFFPKHKKLDRFWSYVDHTINLRSRVNILESRHFYSRYIITGSQIIFWFSAEQVELEVLPTLIIAYDI